MNLCLPEGHESDPKIIWRTKNAKNIGQTPVIIILGQKENFKYLDKVFLWKPCGIQRVKISCSKKSNTQLYKVDERSFRISANDRLSDIRTLLLNSSKFNFYQRILQMLMVEVYKMLDVIPHQQWIICLFFVILRVFKLYPMKIEKR